MRKIIATFLAIGLVGAIAVAPAMAAKKKVVKEDWALTHAPAPILVDVDPNGCAGSVDGVHKSAHSFTAPGNGMLDASIDGFQGDWDLYVYDSSGALLGSSPGDQLVGGAPPVERVMISLKKGMEIDILACNWAGSPTAAGHLVYTYK